MFLLFFNAPGASAVAEDARRSGYVEEWRVHKRKRSRQEEERELYEQVREAFGGVKKVAPKKAPEIAPPALRIDAPPPTDWRAIEALQQRVEAFAERQNKTAIKAAADAYARAVAAYKRQVEERLAEEARALLEAEQARQRAEMIAADDAAVLALYQQRRQQIVQMAIAMVQEKQKRETV